MIKIFKTNNDCELIKIDKIEENTWINLTNPTEDEIKKVVDETKVPSELLIKLLDTEETARIEKEDDATLIVIDVPYIEDKKSKNKYTTLPLGIISFQNYVFTISLKETEVLNDFIDLKVKSIFTDKKKRFLIQILLRLAVCYVKYLRELKHEFK